MFLVGACSHKWTKVRVIFLREELFTVRDELRDRARELDALNDAAHVNAREHLNICIKVCDWVSVSLASQVSHETEEQFEFAIDTDNEQLRAAIEHAYESMTRTIFRYMLFHRVSGLVFLVAVGTRRVAQEVATRWVRSRSPEQVYCRDGLEI